MTALARKLQSRGHEIVFIGVPDIEPVVRAADLDFVSFCESECPPGSIAKKWGRVANLHGLDVARYTARELQPGLIKAAFEHLPEKIADTGVNALILDMAYRFVEIVPMHLRLPYVQIWNVLHFDVSGRHHSLFTVGLMKRARKLSPGMSRDCRSFARLANL
jgi:UDP:flavonoid glycosyltransferase YjiC (YdhE family)